MKNRILGIFVIFCAIMFLFFGTCAYAGTAILNKGPTAINIITTAPNGEAYNAVNIVKEIAWDLVPILWIPEVVSGVLQDNPTFGQSTFSKIPRLLKLLDDSYSPEYVMVTFDLSSLAQYKSWLAAGDMHPKPCIYIKMSDRDSHQEVYIGESRAFYVLKGTRIEFGMFNFDMPNAWKLENAAQGIKMQLSVQTNPNSSPYPVSKFTGWFDSVYSAGNEDIVFTFTATIPNS